MNAFMNRGTGYMEFYTLLFFPIEPRPQSSACLKTPTPMADARLSPFLLEHRIPS